MRFVIWNFSADRGRQDKQNPRLPSYLRWPHIKADQVHGLSLREIGGFTKHSRAPSVRASCYAIAKPSTLVDKMQIIKRLRGHQNAVYCGSLNFLVLKLHILRKPKYVSGYPLCCFHAHPVFTATFDRTGRYVITGSDDRLVKIWAMETTFCLASCRGHEVSSAYCFIFVFTTLHGLLTLLVLFQFSNQG